VEDVAGGMRVPGFDGLAGEVTQAGDTTHSVGGGGDRGRGGVGGGGGVGSGGQWLQLGAVRDAEVTLEAAAEELAGMVGRCRLTVSKPELKARLVLALETAM
jgi:hypothetical protein